MCSEQHSCPECGGCLFLPCTATATGIHPKRVNRNPLEFNVGDTVTLNGVEYRVLRAPHGASAAERGERGEPTTVEVNLTLGRGKWAEEALRRG